MYYIQLSIDGRFLLNDSENLSGSGQIKEHVLLFLHLRD